MPHSLKQRRIEDAPGELQTSGEREAVQKPARYTQDGNVWFPDGNIDIVAEGISFRVHCGILAVHSELFRDMLLMPQPRGPSRAAFVPNIEVFVLQTICGIFSVLSIIVTRKCLRAS